MATVTSRAGAAGATIMEGRWDGLRQRRFVVARAGRVLSAIVLVLLVVSSVPGLVVDGVYREAAAVAAMFRGYDLATLLVAAPVLAGTLLPSLRTSGRAQLLQAGVLAYVVYDYAYYVFGMTFNVLFLVHVATFSVSVFALGFVVAAIDVTALASRVRARTPTRSVAGILTVLAVTLAAMWVFASLRFAVTGQLPDDGNLLVSTIELTHLGYVMDLAVLVPTYLLAAVLLWRRRPWGYVLATVTLVAGIITQVTYMTALVFQARADVPGAAAFDPYMPVIVAVYLVGAGLLLGNIARTEATVGEGPDVSARPPAPGER